MKGACASRHSFLLSSLCTIRKNMYLCTQYGIKLDLGSVFHHRVCDCAGEIGVFRRLRGLPCNDGLDVLLVKDGL